MEFMHSAEDVNLRLVYPVECNRFDSATYLRKISMGGP